MSDCPPTWESVCVADLGEIVAGGTPSRANADYWGGSIPWVTPGEVVQVQGKYLRNTRERITKLGLASSGARLLPPGSIAVTTRATLGEVAIAAEALTTNQGFKSIVPNNRTHSEFAYYALKTLKSEMERLASGTTFLEISKADFSRIRLCRPHLPEQRRIADALDTLDEAIAKTETLIAKLKKVRAGLVHDLLTRGLHEQDHLRDPIAHPEQFQNSSLGRIPNDWTIWSLEQITEPSAPICYGIVQALDFVPDGVPVLAIRDLLGDYVTGLHRTAPSIDASYTRSRVRPGDVLLSIKGTIGRVGLVPERYVGNISRDLARIRPVEWIISEFLVHLLRSPLSQRTLELAQVGTTRAELSIAPLRRLTFAFPPTNEQKLIAQLLDCQGVLIDSHVVELTKLRCLKSGLMTDLLTGRVRVPECLISEVGS